MNQLQSNKGSLLMLRIIFGILAVECLCFALSGVSFSYLHGDPFFNIEADPLSWAFYLLRLPQFVIQHQWAAIVIDTAILVLLIFAVYDPYDHWVCRVLFILLLLFYVTLTGYLAHRNYQTGFFLVLVPFLFKKDQNRIFSFEATRYFLLFFYTSAAILKIINNSLLDPAHFSHLLSGQFTPYYLEQSTGIRTTVNLYLVSHPSVSYILFICSFIVEAITCIGFFTRKFDRWLAIGLLAFHFANWFIMDIPPLGHIAFICLLFISSEMGIVKKDRTANALSQ